MCLKFRVKRTEHLLDIIRKVESEIESFHAMFDASGSPIGDQFLLYLRNLPSKTEDSPVASERCDRTTAKMGVQDHYIRSQVQDDLGSVHVAQPVGKPDVKEKTCFNCGKKGHLAENCPEPKKCSHCGRKDLWQRIQGETS